MCLQTKRWSPITKKVVPVNRQKVVPVNRHVKCPLSVPVRVLASKIQRKRYVPVRFFVPVRRAR